jgi:hypothetical protein
MDNIDIKKCITAAQQRQLKEEVRRYIRDEIIAEAQEEAVKLAKEWLRANRQFVKEVVADEMVKQVKARVKRTYIEITY